MQNYNVLIRNRFADLETEDETTPIEIKEEQKKFEKNDTKYRSRNPIKKSDKVKGSLNNGNTISKVDNKSIRPRGVKAVDQPNELSDALEDPNDLQLKEMNRIKKKHFDKKKMPASGNQRTFDRHSGTGRGKEMKRQGVGKNNWGNDIADQALNNGEQVEEAEKLRHSNKPKGSSPKFVSDYTEYKKVLKAKQEALLLQDEEQFSAYPLNPRQAVDSSELEQAGYEKYEKTSSEDNLKNKSHKQRHHYQDKPDYEDITSQRKKNLNLMDYTNQIFGRIQRDNKRPIRNKPKISDGQNYQPVVR